MKRYLVAACVLVASCAQSIRAGNELGGIVDLKIGHRQNGGLALADAECAKYDKRARITNNDEWTGQMRYECVGK